MYAKEPATPSGDFVDALVELPGVYGTHHIGASTEQAQEAIAAETVRIIQTYLDTGRVPNVVNLSRKTPATHVLVIRHQDRPGVLAHVFDRLREAGINVEETENIIFADAEAAVARISIKGEPPAEVVAAVKSGNPARARRARGGRSLAAGHGPVYWRWFSGLRERPIPRRRRVVKPVAAIQEAIIMATPRVFNFAAGPAVLPLPVLEEAQRDLVSMPGVGMSILEMSHRGKFFEGVLKQTEADIRTLAGVPDDYRILFLPGGASLQFSMVPLNFLPRDGSADYIVSGAWSEKAIKEAKKVGGMKIAWTGKDGNFHAIPAQGDLDARPERRLSSPSPRTRPSTASSSSTCPDTGTCRSCATPRPTCSAARSTYRSTRSSTPAPRRTSARPASSSSSSRTSG